MWPGLYAIGTGESPRPGGGVYNAAPRGPAALAGPAGDLQEATSHAMTPQEIETRIRTQLPGTTATVQSTDNVHFEAVVISPAFAGKRALHRHRLVYSTLGDAMGGDIHALSIQAYTPEEWQELQSRHAETQAPGA